MIELPKRLVKVAHVHVNQRAIEARDNMGRRIQTHQAIITAQRSTILAIETMQHCLDKVNHRLVWRFRARAFYLVACLLLLATPKVNKDHQHPRFEQLRIDGKRLSESDFSAFVILGSAETFEHAIHVSTHRGRLGQREVWIELDRTLKMFDSAVAIFSRKRAKDETCKQVAAAQVLLVGRGILRRCVGDLSCSAGLSSSRRPSTILWAIVSCSGDDV